MQLWYDIFHDLVFIRCHWFSCSWISSGCGIIIILMSVDHLYCIIKTSRWVNLLQHCTFISLLPISRLVDSIMTEAISKSDGVHEVLVRSNLILLSSALVVDWIAIVRDAYVGKLNWVVKVREWWVDIVG